MICNQCKEDKKRDRFYLMEKTCLACRYIMKQNNKKGECFSQVKSDNRITLENHIKNMTNPQTVTEINKITLIGSPIYSMLNNMVKHGHVKRIPSTPYRYKRIDGCDYIMPKRKK